MADSKKAKRKGRRSYLNDFRMTESGNYSYMGVVRAYEGPGPYGAERLRLIVLIAVIVLSELALGFIPAPSMLGYNNFYVVPLYIIELVAVFISAWAAVRLIIAGSEMREYVFDKTVKRLPNVVPIAFYAALVCVAANIVWLCLNGFGEKPAASIAALLLHAVIAVSAFLLRRLIRRQIWGVKMPEPAEEEGESESVFPDANDQFEQ